MSQRLPPRTDGLDWPQEWIDRSQMISFTYEGSRYQGYRGDTVTSALWASGQRLLGRSFKYHRPRGVLSLANHDVNALMQADPAQTTQYLNLRADVTPLESGMRLEAINTFGGVTGDRAAVIDRFSAILPVGFYYKTFLNKRLFPVWERLIRAMTGLGRLQFDQPVRHTPKRYDFCDLLVVGGGIAGLAAALAAAEAGADVVLVDENSQLGGSGGYQLAGDPERYGPVNTLVNQVEQHGRIRVYTQTEAAAYYADHWIPLVDRTRLTKLRAKTIVIATGAHEQPAVFRNNDRPGVMLASAAQCLIYRYGVQPLRRAVLLLANLDGYRAALDLLGAGVELAAVVDLRQELGPESAALAKTLQQQGVPLYQGYCLYESQTNPQGDGICAAVLCPLDEAGEPQVGQKFTLVCDGVVMSVGWAPAANLLYQAGASLRFDPDLQQFVPTQLPAGIFACGRVNGLYELTAKQLDGKRAGLAAAAYLGLDAPEFEVVRPVCESPSHPWPIVAHPKGKNFVDFDEDLQVKDFYHAAQEGFDNIELLKRYSTVGMGPSQGKHSNLNALRILARINQTDPGTVGTTTARPFYHPVPLSHLAGRGFTPQRQTPLHACHLALKARWMQAGQWQRPEYYQQSSLDRTTCIRREVEAVRSRVGLIDVGTLGKLEIRGPQAAEFLERVYTGRYANLKVGMTRYALMLDEVGVIIDDGVIGRVQTDQFYFTTTTTGAAAIYRELSRLNQIWQLDCGLVNLTGARAAVNLAGPQSRTLLSRLTDLDLTAAAFPYLGLRQATVAGIPALLMRVGFVGEWGYEIHVAADRAVGLWEALLQTGAAFGIQPFGIEAQRLLRLEKGHLIVGQDTDGLTTPIEANLGWAVKSDKPFFVGQRSLKAIVQRPPKQRLVGFTLAANFAGDPPQECHLVIHEGEIAGRVTSIGFSPSLQRHIGLAYLPPALAQTGNRFTIRRSDGSLVTATVSPTPFYDPENLRQKEALQPQEVAR
ncbi:MAG: 2Fe-2S iron-sulfur cluster-binding protein [Elainella sp.]